MLKPTALLFGAGDRLLPLLAHLPFAMQRLSLESSLNRLFAELPLIGPMFKQQGKDLRKSELVILLRPQVVSDETWINEIQKSAAAFKELR